MNGAPCSMTPLPVRGQGGRRNELPALEAAESVALLVGRREVRVHPVQSRDRLEREVRGVTELKSGCRSDSFRDSCSTSKHCGHSAGSASRIVDSCSSLWPAAASLLTAHRQISQMNRSGSNAHSRMWAKNDRRRRSSSPHRQRRPPPRTCFPRGL